METKFFVQSTCLGLCSLVKIENLPLLVATIVVSSNTDCTSFLILATSDIKDLVVLPVDKLVLVELEDLPPLRVGAPDLHVV
jgi:hypothetical protein